MSKYLFGILVSVLLDISPSETDGSFDNTILKFFEEFLLEPHYFTFPLTVIKGFRFLHILTDIYFLPINGGYSNGTYLTVV